MNPNHKSFYNEFDPYPAQWLRNLIKGNMIVNGDVDGRDIKEVRPEDLEGHTQAHFFAGIGVWSYALRQAGWPDDRPVWTGSPPCQPFSSAGKRKGTSDPRHLWPTWFELIKVCKPPIIFGEQVASKDGLAWLDIVQSNLETEGYTVAPFDLCAAGFGAPHIRQRLYFVAITERKRRQRRPEGLEKGRGEVQEAKIQTERSGIISDLGNSPGREKRRLRKGRTRIERSEQQDRGPGPTNGFWANAEWIYCRDEKYRPIEPGTFPLASGVAKRVGRLRSYGNSLCAPVAIEFIKAYLAYEESSRSFAVGGTGKVKLYLK